MRAESGIVHDRPARTAVALAVIRPTIRAGLLTPVVGAAAMALAITTATRLGTRSEEAIGLALQVSGLMLACAAGFALEDRSESTVAPVPTTLLERRTIRLAATGAAMAGAWVALGLVSGAGDEVARLTPAFAGLASIAVAVAALVPASRPGRAGMAATAVVLIAVLIMMRLPDRWAVLPPTGGYMGVGARLSWLVITLVAVSVVVLASRDPGQVRSKKFSSGSKNRRRARWVAMATSSPSSPQSSSRLRP